EIGEDEIWDVLNLEDPEVEIQSPEVGTTQIVATRDSVEYRWLFTGPGGFYGLSGDEVADETMFFELSQNGFAWLGQSLHGGHQAVRRLRLIFPDGRFFEWADGGLGGMANF